MKAVVLGSLLLSSTILSAQCMDTLSTLACDDLDKAEYYLDGSKPISPTLKDQIWLCFEMAIETSHEKMKLSKQNMGFPHQKMH